jgi:hypothetical protein
MSGELSFTSVSPLQGDAWAAWNASYHEEHREAYQALSSALYRQAWHERIQAQFARLDAQNARLEDILRQRFGQTRATEAATR